MTETLLKITAGLPYNRRFRIVNGTETWAELDDFEVRSQVRVSADPSSRLKVNLSTFFIASIDDADIVVDLIMTGANTRLVSNGYYDVVVSDVGAIDARGIRIAYGQVQVDTLVTAASDA